MSGTTTRSRRRLAVWLTFAAIGVGMGTVWATGFASIGGQTPNAASAGSTDLSHSPGVPETATLSSKVSPGTGFAGQVTWDGLWGASADTNFFTVDLSGASFSGKKYNVSMLLSNGADMVNAGWVSLQLKVGYIAKAANSTCSDGDFSGAMTSPQVITFDTQDTGAYWSALDGDAVYCIGMKAWTPPSSDGYTLDPNDTFLRRSDTSGPTHYPEFIATVDRGA